MKTTTMHFALSVDVDRFNDRKLAGYLRLFGFAKIGVHSVADLRRACAEYRAKGFDVFPPCDNTQPNGACAGHETSESAASTCEPGWQGCAHRCATHDGQILANGACS